MLKRFLEYTKGYRILTVICPIMIYLDVVVELKIPKVMGEVTDILISIKAGSPMDDITRQLTGKLLEMLLLCAVTLIIGYIASRCSAIASMGFGANLRRELFYKIQSLSFEIVRKADLVQTDFDLCFVD